MWLFDLFFPQILQICYFEVRISLSILGSPLDFKITRVNCMSKHFLMLWLKRFFYFSAKPQIIVCQAWKIWRILKFISGNFIPNSHQNYLNVWKRKPSQTSLEKLWTITSFSKNLITPEWLFQWLLTYHLNSQLQSMVRNVKSKSEKV